MEFAPTWMQHGSRDYSAERELKAKHSDKGLRKLSLEKIEVMLVEHKKWLDSEGETGERANFSYVDFSCHENNILSESDVSGATFLGANLSSLVFYKNLSAVDFKEANLNSCRFLNQSKMLNCNFELADLTLLSIEDHSNIVYCEFQCAKFDRTKALDSDFLWCSFTFCELNSSDFLGSKFDTCSFQEAKLPNTRLRFSVFSECNLDTANFEGSELYKAKFHESKIGCLDHVDLRGSLGYIIDGQSISGTRFSPNAKDPYCLLRRAYTGPKFTLVILLTLVAFFPFIIEALFWVSISKIEESLTTYGDSLFGTQLKAGTKFTVAEILLGFTGEGVGRILEVLFSSLIISYNAVRGWVTVQVSSIREEEERSKFAPEISLYRPYYLAHKYFLRWALYLILLLSLYRVYDILMHSVSLPV